MHIACTFFAELVPICMLSWCLLTKFLQWSSVTHKFIKSALLNWLGSFFIVFVTLSHPIRKRSLRTPSNCLLISLAVADVVLLTTCYVIVIQGFAGGPILGVGGLLIAKKSKVRSSKLGGGKVVIETATFRLQRSSLQP